MDGLLNLKQSLGRKKAKLKCAECEMSFSSTKYLRQHINRAHAGISTECLLEPKSQVKLLSPKLISPIKKKRKTSWSKGKMRPSYTGNQRLTALMKKRENPKSHVAPKTSLWRWKKQEDFLLRQPLLNSCLKKLSDVIILRLLRKLLAP